VTDTHADGPDESDGASTGATPDESGNRDTGGRPCPHCDRPMFHRHCKYVCPQHGVVYDCSDTFY